MDSTEILDCIDKIYFWLLKDKHFVCLEALSRPVNNPIHIFIIIPNIILNHVF